MTEQKKWGFLRQNEESAEKDRDKAKKKGKDTHFTSLSEYLKVIFPETSDWIHDEDCGFSIPGKKYIKPDYRSESLKMIIEFDGPQHYQNSDIIRDDALKDKAYEEHGYKVVRIPYFIQLTNDVVKTMFGVEVKETLFDPNIPSFVDPKLSPKYPNTPAYACPLGVRRMAQEFKKYPQQYEINLKALRDMNPDLSGIDFLEAEYNKLQD